MQRNVNTEHVKTFQGFKFKIGFIINLTYKCRKLEANAKLRGNVKHAFFILLKPSMPSWVFICIYSFKITDKQTFNFKTLHLYMMSHF